MGKYRTGGENRTLVVSLVSCRSTVELHPQVVFSLAVAILAYTYHLAKTEWSWADYFLMVRI